MTGKAKERFEQVRKDIDAVDSELVHLIAKRLALTGQVGKLKAELKLPLYVPSREAELIAEKRHLAEKNNISPDLIEDVIRRIMRDSYVSQNETRSQVSQIQSRKIVIIGGKGQLGGLFVNLFTQSGYKVDVIEQNDWENSETILSEADLVMVAVPIRVTNQVISQLTNLNDKCLLVDITSIKESPLATMLKTHKGPVLGLHPMFGTGIKHLAKQTIVICKGREESQSEWLTKQLETWGAKLSYVEPIEHDHLMSIVQVLRHFSTVVYGYHLKEEKIDLDKVLQLSSPIYRLELIMVGRLFAQNSDLYSDIIFSNKKNISMVKRFLQRLTMMLELLETEDKQKFSEIFNSVSDWFDDKAQKFLDESNLLLAKANDIRK